MILYLKQPVIDNYIFKKQPYASQLDGEYPDKIDIISGSVEHESEIFIRAIWPEPMSGNDFLIK